jgi:ATP-dependent Clp protease ATP-binding subunit ClpA
MVSSDKIEFSQDAAVVAALAGTAMSFSHSAEDQAERWLRALRLHGKVGSAMQALGIGEAPLRTQAHHAIAGEQAPSPPLSDEVVDHVMRRAHEHAQTRGAEMVCTDDLLFAVLEVYDPLLERALVARGASREELEQRLAVTSSPEPC